jgi:hypothetical protein
MRLPLLLFGLGLIVAGCRTFHPARLTPLASEQTITFAVGPIDPPRDNYIGHIVAINSVEPDHTIRVLVGGCINRPGWIKVPKGTTVLGAIKRAGGFDWGASSCVRIVRGPLTYQCKLAFESFGPEFRGHYFIWYCAEKYSPAWGGSYILDKRVRSDIVLEAGDKILVGEVL